MIAGGVGSERFRELAQRHFGFLEGMGFARSRADEVASPVGTSIVFAGRHLGFLVSIDTRDRCVSVRVTRARQGRLAETGPGGYSNDLLAHLVEHAGYRGRGARSGSELVHSEATLDRVLEGWAGFLREAGAELLEDREASIPR